jgi:hypothetical protein
MFGLPHVDGLIQTAVSTASPKRGSGDVYAESPEEAMVRGSVPVGRDGDHGLLHDQRWSLCPEFASWSGRCRYISLFRRTLAYGERGAASGFQTGA